MAFSLKQAAKDKVQILLWATGIVLGLTLSFTPFSGWCQYVHWPTKDSTKIRKAVLKDIKTLSSHKFLGRGYVRGGDSLAALWIAKQYSSIGLMPLPSGWYTPFKHTVNTFEQEPNVQSSAINHSAKPYRNSLKVGADFIPWDETASIQGNYSIQLLDSAQLHTQAWKEILNRTQFENTVLACHERHHKTFKQEVHRYLASKPALKTSPIIVRIKDKLLHSVGPQDSLLRGLDVAVPLSADQLLHLDIKAQEKTLTARNVVGIVPGTAVPDSSIIICAHYDHLGALGPKVYFPGANDNASGVATLLQLAKYLQKHPLRYTVVVIAFAAEEAGLLGSKHLVENYEALMGKPLKHSAFVLNLDLLSAGDKGGMLVNATEAPKAYQLLLKINEQGGYLPVLKGRGPAANSDHYWFYKAGIPALFFYTMGGTPYYHHVNDTWQNLTLTHCRPVQELLTQFLFQYSGTAVPKR